MGAPAKDVKGWWKNSSGWDKGFDALTFGASLGGVNAAKYIAKRNMDKKDYDIVKYGMDLSEAGKTGIAEAQKEPEFAAPYSTQTASSAETNAQAVRRAMLEQSLRDARGRRSAFKFRSGQREQPSGTRTNGLGSNPLIPSGGTSVLGY